MRVGRIENPVPDMAIGQLEDEDTTGGLRAARQSAGESLVTLSDTDARAANLLFRWAPLLP